MSITFLPERGPELKPRITVVGVGGAGGNAVNNMIMSHLEGVEFVVANTDAQSLAQSRTERRIQLGTGVTQGLGAGSRPDIGRAAAEESLEEIMTHLQGCNMVFITAGMGGGTGTGAAPVIARAAREMGILTVGVVTKPFSFEGHRRMRSAEAGIEELQQFVDTLIVIPNQNLFRIATERTTFADAFKMADDVLQQGVRGVTDLMVMPGLINLDFADVRAVMSEMGKAMMGTGEASGDNRAVDAAEAAISNPLLDDTSMKGARGVLINITGGPDMTLFEVDEAANHIRDQVDPDANIIFGSIFDDSLEGRIRISVVATGIQAEVQQQRPVQVAAVEEQPAQPAAATVRTPIFSGQPALRPMPAATTQPAEPALAEDSLVAAETEQATSESFAALRAEVQQQGLQPQIAVSQPAEPAMPRNTYIPEAPVSAPAAAPVHAYPTPATPVAQRPVGQTEGERRAPSLFERVAATVRRGTGVGYPSASTAPQPAAPQAQPQPQQPQIGQSYAPQPQPLAAQRPAEPAAPRPAQPASQGLSVNQADRTPTSRGDDLDIPAFLRRQAN
ncbi:cell division protein FtsZ [Telmatospirillum sp. J64-1]|uniref:cell division protein FtsZ n=1 Tax=Telmatospirillum sp. J64-1 TaxID=2502183 RepID=UPI00115CF57D|nr:cell division protein FtsZ [Telmatospirillum sp. J64-1]